MLAKRTLNEMWKKILFLEATAIPSSFTWPKMNTVEVWTVRWAHHHHVLPQFIWLDLNIFDCFTRNLPFIGWSIPTIWACPALGSSLISLSRAWSRVWTQPINWIHHAKHDSRISSPMILSPLFIWYRRKSLVFIAAVTPKRLSRWTPVLRSFCSICSVFAIVGSFSDWSTPITRWWSRRCCRYRIWRITNWTFCELSVVMNILWPWIYHSARHTQRCRHLVVQRPALRRITVRIRISAQWWVVINIWFRKYEFTLYIYNFRPARIKQFSLTLVLTFDNNTFLPVWWWANWQRFWIFRTKFFENSTQKHCLHIFSQF